MEHEIEDKICNDTKKIVSNISKTVGVFESNSFYMDSLFYCLDNNVKSPIEQVLYVAIMACAKINFIKMAEPEEFRGKMYCVGLYIEPQFKIDKYKVDFRLSYSHTRYDEAVSVLVECDSKQFHDRNEMDRRNEKKRERFIQKQGFNILRFTGREIMKNPMRCACEVISFLTKESIESLAKEVEGYQWQQSNF